MSGAQGWLGRPWMLVALAAPIHIALALATDLSPDEAYYLCAARADGALPPIVDHPPLLPWLLRALDRVPRSPIELRVRLVPIACSLVIGLLCIALARRRGAPPAGAWFVACVSSFALLPMAGGFIATPDGPAQLAIAAGLLWASPARRTSAHDSEHGASAPRPRRFSNLVGALAVGAVLALGSLAKVSVVPAAALFAALAPARTRIERIALLAPVVLVAPLLVPSLRFQLDHAFMARSHPWSLLGAVAAITEAAAVQGLLWTPMVLVWGLRGATQLLRPERWLLASMTALVGLSALARATPPEANWWAPAALVVLVNAGVGAGRSSTRARWAAITAVILPTSIALVHVVRPFLPLPPRADPTARLHGWSEGREPLDAAGVGPYGPAAERCVYGGDCREISNYFMKISDNK